MTLVESFGTKDILGLSPVSQMALEFQRCQTAFSFVSCDEEQTLAKSFEIRGNLALQRLEQYGRLL